MKTTTIFCIFAILFFCGCISTQTIDKSLLPKIKIEEESIQKREFIINVKGPIIVDDLTRCMNPPPDIVCSLFGDFGELVICPTECGVITCVPGAVILCPSGLCYTADP